MEATSNLYLENLHNTDRLETTVYVTDIKQQMDFFWYRYGDSGIRINIGLQNVNVVPLYEDVEHRGDNNYVSGSPHSDEDKAWFDNVTRQHCRYTPRLFSVLSERTEASDRFHGYPDLLTVFFLFQFFSSFSYLLIFL